MQFDKKYDDDVLHFLNFNFRVHREHTNNTYDLLLLSSDLMREFYEKTPDENPYDKKPLENNNYLTTYYTDMIHKSFWTMNYVPNETKQQSLEREYDELTKKMKKIYEKNNLVHLRLVEIYLFQKRYDDFKTFDTFNEICLPSRKQEMIDNKKFCFLNKRNKCHTSSVYIENYDDLDSISNVYEKIHDYTMNEDKIFTSKKIEED